MIGEWLGAAVSGTEHAGEPLMLSRSTQLATADRRRSHLAFDDHPLLVIWEMTQACDLACVHCRASATPGRDLAELTTAEGKRLMDSVAAMGTPLLVLTGGDPAKREDLAELVAYGSSVGLSVAVTPSGTPLMTREVLAGLKDANVARVAVSVDGPTPAIHDRFRGVAGSFAHSLRILEDARELGIERQINTTLGEHNRLTLRDMAALVERTGAVLWSVFVIVPTGRAARSLMLNARTLERDLEHLADIMETAPFDVKTTAAPHFRRVLLQRKDRDAVGLCREVDADGVVQGMRGINDGVGLAFVSHRGDVFPSGFFPVAAGNVRTDDLATVYRDAPLFREARDHGALEGKCGVCPFKVVCGGSRARAFALGGSVFASDPLCAYVPKGWTGDLPSS